MYRFIIFDNIYLNQYRPVYLSYSVINDGAPVRLSRGYDFRGAVCGQGGLIHLPYMY